MFISKKVITRLIAALLLAASTLPVFVPVNAESSGAIIADHKIVDKYDQIPQYWIDQVKKMYLNVPGRSHAQGYLEGLELLMKLNPVYTVNVTRDGPPESYRTDALRANMAVRTQSDGWNYTTFAEQWFMWHAWDNPPSADATLIENHIQYCHDNGPEISAIGFGWCYDMVWQNDPGGTIDPDYHVHWAGSSENGPQGNRRWGLDDADYGLTGNHVNMDDYLAATQQYVDYVQSHSPNTRVFFTTGPVDYYGDGILGEWGVQTKIKEDYIRKYVTSHHEALFDYSDILTYSDNDPTTQYTLTWTDDYGQARVYPFIHPDNMKNLDGSSFNNSDPPHIGEVGCLRLGKAMWWFLARLAGWNGEPVSDTQAPSVTVNSPNGGEKFKKGCQYNINWTATDDVGVTSCNISYSTDNGGSWTDIATGLTNDGSYSWTVPDNPPTTCRVRIAARDAAGNWGQDDSDNVFGIYGPILGDANNDCVVNSFDITKAERIILEIDPETQDADANGDSYTNALDITRIEQIILSPP